MTVLAPTIRFVLVVVEPTICFEKLTAILADGTESARGEFKREHAPGSSRRRTAVALAEEAGGAKLRDAGGCIVFGVNGDGRVSAEIAGR